MTIEAEATEKPTEEPTEEATEEPAEEPAAVRPEPVGIGAVPVVQPQQDGGAGDG